jgi:hypothetical protein
MSVDIEELKKIDQDNHQKGKRHRRKTVSRWLIDTLLDALEGSTRPLSH